MLSSILLKPSGKTSYAAPRLPKNFTTSARSGGALIKETPTVKTVATMTSQNKGINTLGKSLKYRGLG